MLECVNLRKTYGSQNAVAGIDLHVRRGSIFGLLGSNGAGKSTLLKIVTGLIWPDEGCALIEGFDVHRQRKNALKRVGAIIEWPAFYPYLTARENIQAITGEKSRAFNAKIEKAASLVDMNKWLDKRINTFSTGMKQRIGIALACLPDSEFVILDEPANGLDPNGMIELREILRTINCEHGATVLVSSHLLGEIEQVCDDVAIVHNGAIAAAGSVCSLVGDKGALILGAEPYAQVTDVLNKMGYEFTEIKNEPNRYKVTAPEFDAIEINRYLGEAGCRVGHLAYQRRKLEDVFMEIAGGGSDVE